MRDPKRIPEMLAVLGEIWMKHPDLRLGQMIGNVLPPYPANDPYYIEDDKMLAALRETYGLTG